MAERRTTTAVEDINAIEKKAVAEIRNEWREALEDLREERKEMAKVTELLRDFVREYDRLSQRMSTQLRVLVTENQKKQSE